MPWLKRLSVLFFVGLTMCHGHLAAQEDSDWTDLFNGENLDGWVQRGGKAKYEIEDNCIVGSTVPNTPNSFLCTEKNYSDFELVLEFKVDPTLNSGIQIRSNSLADYRKGRVHGYQVEIDPAERGWSCGIYDEARRGWLFDLKSNTAARYAFRQSDWNHYRVRAQGDSIRTWINGVPAANLKDDMTAEGFIALQVHGVGARKDPIEVSWRNIRIRELAADDILPEDETKELPWLEKFAAGEPTKIETGFKFTEGPAMGPDGRIYFSDIPTEKIHVLDPESGQVSEHRADSGKANGLVWTPNDALIACEGGARRITIQRADGKITTLVDKFEGKKLNSPNDITLDGEGGFYFTDPRYGDRENMEMEVEGVYYVNRSRKISRVSDQLKRPNGILLANHGKLLYVADTGDQKIYVFDVDGAGEISNERVFADIGSDGMTIDEYDNVYLTNGKFVHIYSHSGTLVEQIEFPESPSNVTFGGKDRKTLFVTARTSLYSVPMNTGGSRVYANPELPK